MSSARSEIVSKSTMSPSQEKALAADKSLGRRNFHLAGVPPPSPAAAEVPTQPSPEEADESLNLSPAGVLLPSLPTQPPPEEADESLNLSTAGVLLPSLPTQPSPEEAVAAGVLPPSLPLAADSVATTIEDLPMDIIRSEIFSRLDVKTLLRVRVVCKCYGEVIRSPCFRKAFHQFRSKMVPDRIIVHDREVFNDEVHGFTFRCAENLGLLWALPLAEELRDWVVRASCRGLLIISPPSLELTPTESLVVLNPSLRKGMELPIGGVVTEGRVTIGLGYSAEVFSDNDDYLVLLLQQDGQQLKAQVLFLNSMSWVTLPPMEIGSSHLEVGASLCFKDRVLWPAIESETGALSLLTYDIKRWAMKRSILPRQIMGDLVLPCGLRWVTRSLTPTMDMKVSLMMARDSLTKPVIDEWVLNNQLAWEKGPEIQGLEPVIDRMRLALPLAMSCGNSGAVLNLMVEDMAMGEDAFPFAGGGDWRLIPLFPTTHPLHRWYENLDEDEVPPVPTLMKNDLFIDYYHQSLALL